MEHGVSIPLAIPLESSHELMPSTRIPLDREFRFGECRIESSVGIPWKRVFESWLGNSAMTKDLCPKTLERCSISWPGIAILQDAPDPLDTRFTATCDPIEDGLDVVRQNTPLGDQRA